VTTSAQFIALLEAAPDAMVIIDRDGRMVHINAQTEKRFGYERGQLLGQRVELLIPERFRGQHPSHRERYFQEPRTRPIGVFSAAANVDQQAEALGVSAYLKKPVDLNGVLRLIERLVGAAAAQPQ